MNETLKQLATGFVGAVTAFVLFVGVGALADGNPATDGVPRVIHYTGTLERDGAAHNGTATMLFRVFDGNTEAWSETQTVQVYAGRFSVLLGSTTATSANNLSEAINDADDLYLGVTLKLEQGDVVLTNRQRFTPAPFSLWTASASGLKVGGALEIYGPDVTFKAHPDRGDGGRAIVHGTSDSLQLNFGGDLSGGVVIGDPPDPSTAKSLFVNGPTHVSGALSAAGEVQAQGNLAVTGTTTLTGNATASHDLTVTGTAHLGLTVVHCPGTGACSCPAGTALIGGGGDCTGNAFLHESYPWVSENRWQVYCRDGGPVPPDASFAICARVGN
jgi:hypothetical protein